MTLAMYEELFALCERADADASVRVVVLRGAGGKAFVSGTDIHEFASFSSGDDGLRYEATIDRVVDRVETLRVPTVAFVDGYAMGGGLALAAACDLRVCTDGARFGMPIARTVGNCLSMANYARLTALLGEARVKDLIFTARSVESVEALAIGLASRIVESEAEVDELCTLLASHAAVTMRVTKEALRRLRVLPDGDDLVRETYAGEEFRERVAAFLSR
jgi:enoyl-CoA hydratase/carnithine racemase